MTRDDIIKLAQEAGIVVTGEAVWRLCELVVAAERNKIAVWMMERGYATGHGDTVDDLLTEIEWQVREACAHICETAYIPDGSPEDIAAINCAKAIRKRGEK